MFNESEETRIGIVVQDSSSQVVAIMVEKNPKAPFLGEFGVASSETCNDFCFRNWSTIVPI